MMLYFLFCSLIKCWSSLLSSFYGALKVLSLGWRLLTGLPTRARTTSQSTKSSLLNLTKLKRRYYETHRLFRFFHFYFEEKISIFRSVWQLWTTTSGSQTRSSSSSWPCCRFGRLWNQFVTTLSPFCHHFVTIVNFCLLQLFWSTWSAGPRERGGQAGQDQYHGDYDPQRWWSVQVLESLIFDQLLSSDPGSFQFEKRGHLVKESCGEAVLSVIR